jgi:hypothetical protein
VALVQLKLGDMFDGPCDLIVLPCSTSGTITSFVRQRLINYNIPYPKPGMRLGDVAILPFNGGENIAQYVAFASSVRTDRSSRSAIRRIALQLGEATIENPSIKLVSAPLLGAGAGGLPPDVVVAALIDGFKQSAHADARLVVHVLDEGVFRRLSQSWSDDNPGTMQKRRTRKRPVSKEVEQPIRVFISYSHTSPQHKKWVEELGSFLRGSGIDARMDVWHLRRGMDLPQFMTNELTLANRVILVSDEKYAEKADGRVGGVGWETMIIQGDMSQQPADGNKYLVVVRSKSVKDGLPRYLQSKFVIHWPDDGVEDLNLQILLQELYDVVKVPPLGPKPVFL